MISPAPETQRAIALVQKLPPNQLAIALNFLAEPSQNDHDDEMTLREIIQKALPIEIDCMTYAIGMNGKL